MKRLGQMTTAGRRRRGTAEIELMGVIPLLLVILLLTGVALVLGKARLANVVEAEQSAYKQVLLEDAANPVSPSTEIVPAAAIDGLANRYDEGRVKRDVEMKKDKMRLPTVTLEDKAVFLDSTWHYAAWPRTEEREGMKAWMEESVEMDRWQAERAALGLKEPWPP